MLDLLPANGHYASFIHSLTVETRSNSLKHYFDLFMKCRHDKSTCDMLLPISDAMSSEAINPTSLPSPSSGNILMLLNVLYTPGFVLHTPNLPLLNGYCV
ncbi:unnamed protein product [Brugia pahangi]|uniref:Uncharacterized protein n=1 Tax=Brugia pahangi TaxID=6280 RepID=A0A158PRA0_BRUPA|nr:unnamed protein product [Brugia pahangi]